MLTVDPMISPGLWVTLALAGAALLAVYGWRRPGGIMRVRWGTILALMGLAFALVLLILLNPTLAEPVPPPPGKPLLTILVDSSASMATPDGENGTRYAAAVAAAKEIETRTPGTLEVHVRRFDETTRGAGAQDLEKAAPTGEVTDIAGAVLSSLESDRPQGQAMVLLTDGIQTTGGGSQALRDAARAAKAAGAPIYAVTIGGENAGAGRPDVAIEAHTQRELAFAGQKITLAADIRSQGYSGKVTVHLIGEGRDLQTLGTEIAADKPATVKFEVMQEKPGLYPYELRIDSVGQEMTDANNSSLCLLRVVDKAVRVMLVEGKPYWDSKFLVRELASDASIDLQSIVQVAPGRIIKRSVQRNGEGGGGVSGGAASTRPGDQWQVLKDAAAVLADPASLQDCQIVILGRDTEEFLSPGAVANLQRWVSRDGGALVCYRGSPVGKTGGDAGLSRLLPVKWQPLRESRYQMELTEMGRSLNWFGNEGAGEGFLAALPPLAADAQVEQTRPLAVVLARGKWPAGAAAPGREETPVVSYQPYGAGRVVVIEGAGMWRWAFPPGTGGGETSGEEVYGAVWHAMFRWIISGAGLIPGEDAAIRPDKLGFQAREPAAATVLLRAWSSSKEKPATMPSVRLHAVASDAPPATAPSDRTIACEASGDDPGAYRVQLGVLPPGRYELVLENAPDAARAVFDVKRVGEEELNLAARPDVLAMLGAESGGGLLKAADAGTIATHIRDELVRARPQRMSFLTAWDRPWVFGVILLLWAAAWALRRSSGLV